MITHDLKNLLIRMIVSFGKVWEKFSVSYDFFSAIANKYKDWKDFLNEAINWRENITNKFL